MRALLLSSVYGYLAFNENQVLFEQGLGELSVKQLAQTYVEIQKGEFPPNFQDFIAGLKSQGYTEFEIEEPFLLPYFNQTEGLAGILSDKTSKIKAIRALLQDHLSQYFQNHGKEFYPERIPELTKVLSEYMLSQQISEKSTQHDFHIKQAVETINDLDRSLNFFASRLREWYGLHFPELTDKLVDDHEQFATFVEKLGMRSNFTHDNLMKKMDLLEMQAVNFEAKAERSMGGQLTNHDIAIIQKLAQKILNLFDFRREIERYISDTLDSVAPNLKCVLGAPIASKLIAIAGSLEHLSEVSSSTIQVLGAEKALFKALKTGGDTPKYGIIFQWHKIRGEKAYLRGKIARMLAGKLSILAKVDYYKGNFIGEEYKKVIDDKIALIKKQYPTPPKTEKRKSRRNDIPVKKRNRNDRRSHDRKGADRPNRDRDSRRRDDNRGKGGSGGKGGDRDRRSRDKSGDRSSGRSSGNRQGGGHNKSGNYKGRRER